MQTATSLSPHTCPATPALCTLQLPLTNAAPPPSLQTGARNERRLVAVHCAKDSGFEAIHGLLNRVMEVLGVPHESEWPQWSVWTGPCFDCLRAYGPDEH